MYVSCAHGEATIKNRIISYNVNCRKISSRKRENEKLENYKNASYRRQLPSFDIVRSIRIMVEFLRNEYAIPG